MSKSFIHLLKGIEPGAVSTGRKIADAITGDVSRGGVPRDLTDEALLEAAAVVTELQCTGMVLTNTTVSREGLVTSSHSVDAIGNGGLSGEPLAVRSSEVLSLIRKIHPDMTLISVGGIGSKEEGKKRLDLGADFLQVYTGFVYGGPRLIKRLAKL